MQSGPSALPASPRRRAARRLLLLPAVAAALALAALLAAAEPAPRSAATGVYSQEQIARGKKAYQAECARCHGEALGGGEDSPALVGKEFLKNWAGHSLGELVEYTRKEMPSDGPGKLSRKLCTDVTAFVLSANGFPAGTAELEPKPEILDQIQIPENK
jgi:S-disulfanyl-L-cysteine oxidoreductase SoxD